MFVKPGEESSVVRVPGVPVVLLLNPLLGCVETLLEKKGDAGNDKAMSEIMRTKRCFSCRLVVYRKCVLTFAIESPLVSSVSKHEK